MEAFDLGGKGRWTEQEETRKVVAEASYFAREILLNAHRVLEPAFEDKGEEGPGLALVTILLALKVADYQVRHNAREYFSNDTLVVAFESVDKLAAELYGNYLEDVEKMRKSNG